MSISISEIDPTITIDKLQFSPENQYFERKNTVFLKLRIR